MPTQLNLSPYPDHSDYASVLEQLDDLDAGFHDLLQESMAVAVVKNDAWHRLLEACQGNPVGFELKSSNGQYALILPDASEPGRYRAQMFDAKGFFGHSTRDSALQVLDELIVDGYIELAPGAMERLSQAISGSLGLSGPT